MQEVVIHVEQGKDKLITLVENGKLLEKYQELEEQKRLEGNIYIGKVENVLFGMQAAFIDIGENKNTFIHIRDVIPKASDETGNKNEKLSKHDIKNYIRPGMSILVQVTRDSTNRKGARVSTHISFSGRFVVVMPNANFVTISQKIENEEERKRLKEIASACVSKGYGVIVRTAAYGKDEQVIQKDLNEVIKKLEKIKQEFNTEQNKDFKDVKPRQLYQNEGLVHKILKDVIDYNIDKIWVDDENEYNKIEELIKNTDNTENVKLTLKKDELLKMYDLEAQLEETNKRKIWLKCGGFITIDKTEALTAIDVNSGKYIGSKDLEQTVFRVNKEASIEIAKQIRLRDIGGIIIVDYIDMERQESKEKIKEILQEHLKKDRSRTQVIGFTPLNLLEMTRKHMCSND